MKQGTIKTLGTAALGVAFAATAAGTASAAPAGENGSAPANVSEALQSLPVDQTAKSITGGKDAGKGSEGLKANNKGNLLGGLPPGGLTKALPLG
ncbi:hypothetical protein [Streptomyces sp. NPDC007100]|uniref:hypothetical protein n=1 Tax=unclassified Streptomyces TaxID=2593676 RepID=UPI003401AF80